jgi:hypothetical protein
LNNAALIQVLAKFYSSPMCVPIYRERWDVWCIQNGHMDDYLLLMMKSDAELAFLIERAKAIANSPLTKALS